MIKKDAEDYRYGYQHIGIVNQKEVSIRKISNCGGWSDLETGETYMNWSVDIIKVHSDSISKMKKPIKLSDKELVKALELLRKETNKEAKEIN